MSTIRVTAKVMFDYDPADGLVTTEDEGREDMIEMINNGGLTPSQFEITTKVLG